MIMLFLLGLLQGLIGWVMVMSGLNEENVYVNHYRLAIHFMLALGLICYTLWFALQLLLSEKRIEGNRSLRIFTAWIIAVLLVQLTYGAFMAGLKAASYAPTWPDINGNFLPHGGRPDSGIAQFFDNPLMVHFIHRTLGYIIFVLIAAWYIRARTFKNNSVFKKTSLLPLVLVFVQVVLGILTVVNSPFQKTLLWLGVAHQFVAMMLLLSLVCEFFLLHNKEKLIAG